MAVQERLMQHIRLFHCFKQTRWAVPEAEELVHAAEVSTLCGWGIWGVARPAGCHGDGKRS